MARGGPRPRTPGRVTQVTEELRSPVHRGSRPQSTPATTLSLVQPWQPTGLEAQSLLRLPVCRTAELRAVVHGILAAPFAPLLFRHPGWGRGRDPLRKCRQPAADRG